MKSLRGFPKPESRRIGNVVIVASMLLSLCILSLIKAHYCSSPYGKSQASMKLEVPVKEAKETNAGVKMVTEEHDPPEDEDEDENTTTTTQRKDADAEQGENATTTQTKEAEEAEEEPPVDLSKPVCYESSKRSDTCEAVGDVRVRGGGSNTIFHHPSSGREWKIKPYARKGDSWALGNVKEWSLKPLAGQQPPPRCTVNHTDPAIVFSTGGFTGNLFHDFTDVLVPLFITAYRFHGRVHLLATEYKSWWMQKFTPIFRQLSRHEVVDLDSDGEETVRCFRRVVVGLSFHKELGVDASRSPGAHYSMADFKRMLRSAFGLERATAAPSGDEWDIRRRPRLLIISRQHTRAFLNERAMADMAASLGFDVRLGHPDISTDMAKFARLVNSADVLLGVHGAGLTNMVFLPAGAVLIQVVPLGGLDWLVRDTFQDPSGDMELHYIEYRVQADESTLSEEYPKNHPVLTNPEAIHKQGWNAIKTVYLDKQNVRPHMGRLRKTLLEALKLLPHSRQH